MAEINLPENISDGSVDAPADKPTLKRQNSQLKWIMIIMVACIVLVVSIPLYNQFFVNNFEYHKLQFQKIKEGNLVMYQTKVPVTAPSDKVTGSSVANDYIMRFRSDPRELEKIPIDQSLNNSQGIKFVQKNRVYISIDPKSKACSDNLMSVMTLAGFLKDSNLEIKSASPDEKHANETNIPYINCKDSASNTVLIITATNQTKITQQSTNCYIIEYKDCEIMPVIERFILKIVEQHMDRLGTKIVPAFS